MLQGAGRCRALQGGALCCSVDVADTYSQKNPTCSDVQDCSVLQSVAKCCRVLQCTAVCFIEDVADKVLTGTSNSRPCKALQCVEECCRVSQGVAG